VILPHLLRRGIQAVLLADNFREYLRVYANTRLYWNLPLDELVQFWRECWFQGRTRWPEVMDALRNVHAQRFSAVYTFA